MSAWLALFLMVGVWILPAIYFGMRYLARRWRMSAVISAVFAWCLILDVNSLGFLPKGYGWVVASLGIALGVLVDIAIIDDVRRKHVEAAAGISPKDSRPG